MRRASTTSLKKLSSRGGYPAPSLSKETVTCRRCGISQPGDLRYFARNPKKKNGLDSHCRACSRQRARKNMASRRGDPIERAKVIEANRRYRQTLKGREKKRLDSQIY